MLAQALSGAIGVQKEQELGSSDVAAAAFYEHGCLGKRGI
jgi:hypothetical protein